MLPESCMWEKQLFGEKLDKVEGAICAFGFIPAVQNQVVKAGFKRQLREGMEQCLSVCLSMCCSPCAPPSSWSSFWLKPGNEGFGLCHLLGRILGGRIARWEINTCPIAN